MSKFTTFDPVFQLPHSALDISKMRSEHRVSTDAVETGPARGAPKGFTRTSPSLLILLIITTSSEVVRSQYNCYC